MPIIPNIATVKKYLAVNYTNSTASLPPMRKAESELRKVLGDALFGTVQQQVVANADTELVQLCQDYVCHYAYWLYLPDMMVPIGETGPRVNATENNPQPFKWQYREKRMVLALKAMMAMDDLLTLLLSGTVAGWVEPEQYKGRCISTGAHFATYYPLRHPEAVFLQLLPIVAEVERTIIHKTIGAAFYDALILTTDPVLEDIRAAVAHFTIKLTVSKLNCQLTPDGFTVLMDPPDDPRSGQVSASDQRLSSAAATAEASGQTYLYEAKKTLNEKAAATGPYALYYASPLYVDPFLESISPNACRRGVFGM